MCTIGHISVWNNSCRPGKPLLAENQRMILDMKITISIDEANLAYSPTTILVQVSSQCLGLVCGSIIQARHDLYRERTKPFCPTIHLGSKVCVTQRQDELEGTNARVSLISSTSGTDAPAKIPPPTHRSVPKEIPRVCGLIKPASASVKRPNQKHYKGKKSSLGKLPSCRTAEHVTASLDTATLERFASVARCQRKHAKVTPRRFFFFPRLEMCVPRKESSFFLVQGRQRCDVPRVRGENEAHRSQVRLMVKQHHYHSHARSGPSAVNVARRASILVMFPSTRRMHWREA